MPLSKNINTYTDVKAILDQIQTHGSGIYTLATPGKARNWMMRAYQFRKLFQDEGKLRANIKGYTPPTNYDTMRMRLVGHTVEIDFAPEPEGTLTLPSGEKIKPASAVALPSLPETEKREKKPVKSADVSDLETLALRLAEEFGADED